MESGVWAFVEETVRQGRTGEGKEAGGLGRKGRQ